MTDFYTRLLLRMQVNIVTAGVGKASEGLPTSAQPPSTETATHLPSTLLFSVNQTAPAPRYLHFTDENIFSAILYSVVFLIATSGNISVLYVMLRHNSSNVMQRRVRLFITHLCCADLIVSLIMIPIEVAWHLTNAWLAGDVMCRILMFLRTFGFYLGSFILMGMSIDRYYAVKNPLALSITRARRMVAAAWVLSAVASSPQVRKAP